MTHVHDLTLPLHLLKLIQQHGPGAMREAFEYLLNTAMVLERNNFLNAGPYERAADREGHANGFKPKSLKTTAGTLSLRVPQTRGTSSPFYPACLQRGTRSERSYMATLARMYIQGVSTRKVKKILEELCGTTVSSTEVSRATKELDNVLETWRKRPLSDSSYRYLYLDARYEKIRIGKSVRSCAVLIAIGINDKGRRSVLGVSVALSEAKTHWRAFLESLVARGLQGVELVISDHHAGLTAAVSALLGHAQWQRCQFHFQKNARHHLPKKKFEKDVTNRLREAFNAPNREVAEDLVDRLMDFYRDLAPDFVDWLQENIASAFTIFNFPEHHRIKLRTTNPIENLNKQIRRRTRVITIFPDTDSCLRLISAILMDQTEIWEDARCPYLNLNI